MKRTTIMLPEDVDARLRLEARRHGLSIADVAREAIERHLPSPAVAGRLGFFGVGEGHPADVSDRVDEFVGQAVARRTDDSAQVLIVDAGPLYPAAASRDRNHHRCVELLAERHQVESIATLDHRHFSVVRPEHVEAFTLLP